MKHWQTDVRNRTAYFHCDNGAYDEATSYLTGRLIIANRSPDRFLVAPLWDARCTAEAVSAALSQAGKSKGQLAARVMELVEELREAEAPIDFLLLLERIISACGGLGSQQQTQLVRSAHRNLLKKLLVSLWAESVIAWPDVARPFPKAQLFNDLLCFDGPSHCLERLLSAQSKQHAASSYRFSLTHFFLSHIGFLSIGELTPDTCAGLERKMPQGTHVTIAKTIYALQVGEFGTDLVKHQPEDLGCPAIRAKTHKTYDTNFTWLDSEAPHLNKWRQLASEWSSEAEVSKRTAIATLNAFFKHAMAVSNFPTDPLEYLKKGLMADEGTLWCPKSAVYINKFREFLEWILETRCSAVDQHDLPVRLPEFWNPLPAAKHQNRRSETHREAMPTLFVRLALEILTENDWGWCRDLGARRFRGGDMILVAGTDGTTKKVWAPVRAVAMWLKLRMPFRTLQVRLLDSGEADTFLIDRATGASMQNTAPYARGSLRSPIQRGVIQSCFDRRAGRSVFVLRLNTNKTDDVDREAAERGYDCPYAPEDVVLTLAWLADWQREYNPLTEPTDWTDVQELRNEYSQARLYNRETCFLFRDAASSNRTEPLRSGRLAHFWANLLAELQKRLAARSILQADGNPYVLIDDQLKAPAFDLHELRVTGITALYENGLPVEIIMKIVGHATFVMTLYYAKVGEYEIQLQADEAAAERLRQEQRNWTSYQRQQQLAQLQSTVAWNDESGLSSFAEAGPGVVLMDTGICPVGGSKCHIGGERMKSSAAKETRWRPVVGGKSNCPACRFHISGPPFLHGLIARFNQLSAAANEKARFRSATEQKFEELDAERRRTEGNGLAFTEYREWQRHSTDLDLATAELDGILLRLNSVVLIIDQCRVLILSQPARSSGSQLIVRDRDSFEIALAESTEFDLLDRICLSSEIFGSVDASSPNIRRQRAYDKMLIRNGLSPAFLGLDEDTSLRVGNQLSRILTARVGRPNTLNLMDGGETLARLGIGRSEVERFFLEQTGSALPPAVPPPMIEQHHK